VKWSTDNDLNAVGFEADRAAKKEGTFTQVNKELVHAQNAVQLAGRVYKDISKKGKAVKTYFYRLEIVHADGTRE
jgi:hypothetical protein